MSEKTLHLAVVVLAAGRASRFGSPKQLADFKGKTLLAAVLGIAKKISTDVSLVTGAYADKIEAWVNAEGKSRDKSELRIVKNPDWPSGLGSSISAAIAQLPAKTDAALVLLADQPLVTESHLKALVDCWAEAGQSNRPWSVATRYSSSPNRPSLGVPALFDRTAFVELAVLTGDRGARSLLNSSGHQIQSVEPDFALVDIDTPEQLEVLKACCAANKKADIGQ